MQKAGIDRALVTETVTVKPELRGVSPTSLHIYSIINICQNNDFEFIKLKVLIKNIYYIDTDEIPGFFVLLKNHIFVVRSEDTIFIFHV